MGYGLSEIKLRKKCGMGYGLSEIKLGKKCGMGYGLSEIKLGKLERERQYVLYSDVQITKIKRTDR